MDVARPATVGRLACSVNCTFKAGKGSDHRASMTCANCGNVRGVHGWTSSHRYVSQYAKPPNTPAIRESNVPTVHDVTKRKNGRPHFVVSLSPLVSDKLNRDIQSLSLCTRVPLLGYSRDDRCICCVTFASLVFLQ